MILSDYACPTHGPFEQLVASPAPDSVDCPSCGADSCWIPSAVFGKVRMVEAHRGKADARPGALAFDTRSLAEGEPLSEWKARREKAWQEHDHKVNKEVLRG